MVALRQRRRHQSLRSLHHHLRPLRQRQRARRSDREAGRDDCERRLDRLEHELASPLRSAQRSRRAREIHTDRSAHLHPQLSVEQRSAPSDEGSHHQGLQRLRPVAAGIRRPKEIVMTAAGAAEQFPTMIIPRGTEIKLNVHGQLSIKTPGNLVIQNSGNYSEIESTNGSIRIEENVAVEAVSVKAGQVCYIQGTLTAWKVRAKRITLEDRAKAFIMVQESDLLELSKSARLVGNFANEKELYLMMGKFSSQLRELPGAVDMHSHAPLAETRPPQISPAQAA